MLECLHGNYGDLDENDLDVAEKSLMQEFDILEPFSIFVNRVEESMAIEETSRVLRSQ